MERPVAQTHLGEVQGLKRMTKSGVNFFSFKGIPFAEPPVGDLRFKAPIPKKPWAGIRNASNEGNKSPQLNTMNNFAVLGDEDCLYLNVYTPNLPKISKDTTYPVMVYIHGGGFRMGSGHEEEFGPEYIVERDTVVVTINYRLGIFGFLCLDIPDVPGNCGLKDQHLALTWVKENISHFSGDSNNITIFGISAGGASVEYQLLYPKSKDLFTKAIAQSGSALCPWALNKNPRDFVKKVTTILGISEEDPFAILNLLKTFGIKDLLTAAFKATDLETKKRGDLFGFGPVIEKQFQGVEGFLTIEPYELLKSGNFLKVPTISSLCRDEGSLFTYFYDTHVNRMIERQYIDYMTHLNLKNCESVNADLTKLYTGTSDNERKQVHNFLTDLMFASPISTSLKLRSKTNKENYGYIFSFTGILRHDLYLFGFDSSDETQHGAELPYLSKLKDFEHLEKKITAKDHTVRNWIVALFTNFAKFGNPTPEGSTFPLEWKKVKDGKLDVLDINDELRIIPFPWGERMDVWEKFYS